MNQNDDINLNNLSNDEENQRNDQLQPLNAANISQSKTSQRRLTLSFVLLLMISLGEFAVTLFTYVSPHDYSISLWPVMNKGQYYRIITHFFIHYGFFHLAIDLVILYYLLKSLEKLIGTMYTLCFIIHSMLLSSVIFLFFMLVVKYLIRILDYNVSINFNSECGLSPLGFSLLNFYFLFAQNHQKNINVLLSIEINGRYAPLFFLMFVYLFTPNRSFFGHLSGIIAGLAIKGFLAKYIFPRRQWVEDMENIIGSFKSEFFYVNILNKDEQFNSNIDELLNFHPEPLVNPSEAV